MELIGYKLIEPQRRIIKVRACDIPRDSECIYYIVSTLSKTIARARQAYYK